MADYTPITPGSGANIATLPVTMPDSSSAAASVGVLGTVSGGNWVAIASGNPLPVTVENSTLAVTQSGSWTVTANAGSGTQAVSAASLPLPSGASTAAKQPALGTAGSASSDVITIQGIASMTAVSVSQSGNWSTRSQDGSGNALTSLSVGSQRSITVAVVDGSGNQVTSFGGSGGTASNFGSTFPSSGTAAGATDGTNMQPLKVDGSGNLKINVSAGTVAATQSGTWNVGTVTTVTTCSTVTSLTQWNGNTIDTNSGNKSAGTLRVVVATDQPQLTNALKVDPSGVTSPVSGTVTANQGTAGGSAWPVTQTPATSGGDSLYSVNSSGAANQDAASIKSSAGQIYGYACFNTTASARYVKLYNASSPTSSSTPIMRIYLPPTGGANVSMPDGIACGTAIGIRITTGAADNDTGACSSNDVLANVWYK